MLTETNRTLETKVGDYFYKVMVQSLPFGTVAHIVRTKNANARTGFGAYGAPTMVQTPNKDGEWVPLLQNEPIDYPSVTAATALIPVA